MYTTQPETATVTSSYAESTKYVADILSSMANGGVETPTSMVPNFLVSSPGSLLTPNTLNTIEQSFIQLQEQQQQQLSSQTSGTTASGAAASSRLRQSQTTGTVTAAAQQPITQSGFVPPVVDSASHVSADASQDSQDASSDYSDDWEPSTKRGRMTGGKGGGNADLIVTANGATVNAAPQRKYTRRNKDEKLPPEEEERRRVRRERNKLAAAKCRQRRVDHTNELVEETEELEREQSVLEQEIANLQQEKEQLEFILQAHQPVCKVAAAHRLQQQQQQQSQQLQEIKVKVERPPSLSPPPPTTAAVRPQNLSLNTSSNTLGSGGTSTTNSLLQPEQQAYQPSPPSFSAPSPQALVGGHIESLAASARPNSLPLIKRNRARILQASNASGGIYSSANASTPNGTTTTTTINTPNSGLSITPSSLFCPGLESMVDGSTGLTPLTGHSCANQVGVAVPTSSTATTESGSSAADAAGAPTLISL